MHILCRRWEISFDGHPGAAARLSGAVSRSLYFLKHNSYGDPAMDVLLSLTVFLAFGAAFVFVNLAVGSLARPKLPNSQKSAPYECGEPSVGSSWVQFDLRFYIVALVFLIFDVEVALFYPWAVAFGDAAMLAHKLGMTLFAVRAAALVDLLFFFGVLLVGFAYLWRFGYLDWVRSAATTSLRTSLRRPLQPGPEGPGLPDCERGPGPSGPG